MSSSEFNFSIDLPARSEWANVDLLRTSVLNCFTAMFNGMDQCHTLAMITGELLENAVKYGDWARERSHFRLRVWGQGRQAFVAVENPVAAGAQPAAELFATLEWMKRFSSAEEAYRARLLEIAAAPPNVQGRLGLVRVAYEGNCLLDAELRSGDLVCVTASISLG